MIKRDCIYHKNKCNYLVILNFPIRFAISLILDFQPTLILTLTFTLSRQMIQWPRAKLNFSLTQCSLYPAVFVYSYQQHVWKRWPSSHFMTTTS